METTLKLGTIVADLVRKDIKNVHLSVYPSSGRVRISAPAHMNVDTVRAFAISKLGWIKARRLVMELRASTTTERRQEILDAWYRAQLREAAMPLIAKWEPRLAVRVDRLFIQRMKTKWGNCSRFARAIRLNTELAKKPRECLEYIVIHEMVHLLEPNHGKGFIDRMERTMPLWRQYRRMLNQPPVRHEEWLY